MNAMDTLTVIEQRCAVKVYDQNHRMTGGQLPLDDVMIFGRF